MRGYQELHFVHVSGRTTPCVRCGVHISLHIIGFQDLLRGTSITSSYFSFWGVTYTSAFHHGVVFIEVLIQFLSTLYEMLLSYVIIQQWGYSRDAFPCPVRQCSIADFTVHTLSSSEEYLWWIPARPLSICWNLSLASRCYPSKGCPMFLSEVFIPPSFS